MTWAVGARLPVNTRNPVPNKRTPPPLYLSFFPVFPSLGLPVSRIARARRAEGRMSETSLAYLGATSLSYYLLRKWNQVIAGKEIRDG